MNLLIRALWPYLTRYRWPLIWGIVFILISNWFSIYPAQVVRDAFNLVSDLIRQQELVAGTPAGDALSRRITYTLLLFGGIVVVAALLRGFFLYLVRQTIIVVSRHIEFDQKNELFDKYQLYSLSILRRRQTGDLMARIGEDVAAVRMFTGPGIMYTLSTITLFTMVMATMVVVNAELTLYVLLPMPVLALSIYLVHERINKRSEQAQNQLSTISSFTQEAFSGIRLLRAYTREDVSRRNFNQQSDVYMDLSLRLAKVDALFFPTILLLVGLSTVLTVWVGGEKVIAGTVTLGNIAEFILYINLLTWPVASLGWITSMIQKAAASQKRINELLALESELQFPASSEPVTRAHIQFVDVSFTYADTGIRALRGIHLDVPAGTTLGIVGTTGSGKTTLTSMLLRFMDPTEGAAFLDGRLLSEYSKEALRGAIGYVPQDVFLFSDTIANNIAFGKMNATREEVEAAARFAGVYDDIVGFPDGFETVIGERGVTLSGGQKQRLSIARAYLGRPKLLILDDALSAVDTRTEATILDNLRGGGTAPFALAPTNGHPSADGEVAAGYRPTLVIVSHRISAVQDAQQIIVMDEGQIVERGTHAELLARRGAYAELYTKQLLEAELKAEVQG